MAGQRERTLELAALGRPFSLGMLYDCRNDSLIPALTLWDREDLEKDAFETLQPNSSFDIVASDSIEDKSNALNVEASLKASFLCGLIEVEGAAKYLSDCKTSRNQARVTLQYKNTTKLQQLSMNHIGRGNVKHPDVFESGKATHVVTGILYGSHAFFVLDREVSEKENRQEIEGNLQVLIKKMTFLNIKGEGALKMEDADIAKVDKFSCRFHGDFHLERHPVSFQEAIEVYQSLPTLLGSDGKNTVPQKVWLMPLKNLDSAAAQLVRQISDTLIRNAQNVLEDLGELERRCKDAEKWPIHQQFPQIKKKVKTFKGLVSQFKLEFQKTMARKLPSIRGGGEEEGTLANILKSVQSSPFNSIDLNEWMDCKETENKIIRSLVDNMLHMTMVTSRSTLQFEIHSGDATHTVSFVFTSLETPEPYLSALSNYLDEANKPDYVPCKYDVDKEQWFFSDDEMDKVQQEIKLFKDFAEANRENRSIRFLTAALRDDEKKGAIVRLYTDGFLVNDNFEPPSKPAMITCGITHNSVTLNISPPRFGLAAVINYAVEVYIDDVWLQHMECQAGDVTVSGLKSDEEYRFRCRAMCAVGLGPACEASALIKTLSPVPPEKQQVQLAEFIKSSSKLIKSGSPSVFKLSLEKSYFGIDGFKSYTFGKHSVKRNRTIMLLGATGSGKTTLINGMINYILGIDWKDSFRFKLIDESQSKSQAQSQTSHVTAYKVNYQDGFRVPYSLTIVDTPGFGDTRGIDRDREITEQIRRLFTSANGVSEIDAICFVTQASQSKLIAAQKCVFDSVLSIFGKDMAENICMLVTFADGQQPPVLQAINTSRVPCPKTAVGLPVYHQFNNSALFADNRSVLDRVDEDSDEDMKDDIFDTMFWAMGAKSMRTFFTDLDKVTTQSLQLTQEVLNERRQLEAAVEGLQPQVLAGLAKLEELRLTQQQIQMHNADITYNENFQIEVEVIKPSQILTRKGENITNCQQCSVTCHYPCAIEEDSEKHGCAAMKHGNCVVCPGKCVWNIHFNQKYRWDYVKEKQMKTMQELKDKYERASRAKITDQQLFENQKEEIANLQDEVMALIGRSSSCIARLKEIALRPDPLSTPEYIDLFIAGERSEAKEGYMARIQSLEIMKEKAQIIDKVAK
ncbi:hypothetical protein NHX12_004946 [Muraenolepis orangiensis]|uniref:Fibronectin type-III domain-containing protein n=1 Tax=Muraenolepis orangiensis TaxID=630683 RepID=A0A9Q0DWH1_9TELE|nr:hypothetical protein NHX12_004946 [Muraenolepis orangiensis]